MKWTSVVSVAGTLEEAIRDAGSSVRAQVAAPDLVFAFASQQYGELDDLPGTIGELFPTATILGCSAGGVIGGGKEVERQPALSLTAAALPGVRLSAFHAEIDDLPDRDDPESWKRRLDVVGEASAFVLLPDPFTFDSERLLLRLDLAFPASRKVGGLASGGRQPGENSLFVGGQLRRSGVVGLALSGNVEMDTIVAQGCRPIGQPMFVTRCEGNLLWQLDGESAVSALQDLYDSLDPSDQALARHSLFLGIVMSESQQQYGQGDFLIRNLLDMDGERGILAVGTRLREGAVVQFHLRDKRTSAEDLEHLLSRHGQTGESGRPRGALLFSCLGRGVNLYDEPDHDSSVFRRRLGEAPLGGFFCNGEIGPVLGRTYLHGYTSAFGLFRSRD
jgi:small ligand-binding sensory domain FIST